MRFYRLFYRLKRTGKENIDPILFSSVRTKTTGEDTVEILTPQKDDTFFNSGHWYAEINPNNYDLNTVYVLEWIFELVAGRQQKIEEYFKLSDWSVISGYGELEGQISDGQIAGKVKDGELNGGLIEISLQGTITDGALKGTIADGEITGALQ